MPANIPQSQTFTARAGVSVQIDLETRVRRLEERLAKLEAIIKITGNRVDIKTIGKMGIKASTIDLDAGRHVKAGGKVVACKGDWVSGSTNTRLGRQGLIDGKVE